MGAGMQQGACLLGKAGRQLAAAVRARCESGRRVGGLPREVSHRAYWKCRAANLAQSKKGLAVVKELCVACGMRRPAAAARRWHSLERAAALRRPFRNIASPLEAPRE